MAKKQFRGWGIVFILLILAVPQVVSAQGGGNPAVRFTHLDVDDGLSGQRVLAVIQDPVGFMWFGTEEGLNQYDGYTFTVYKYDAQDATSLSNNVVNTVYVDRAGTLWVGTLDGLNRFDQESGTFRRYMAEANDPGGLSHGRVRAICEDGAGMLWVATLGGLNRLDPTTGRFTHFFHNEEDPQSLSDDRVWALYLDREGVLWVGTSAGLDRFDPATGAFIHYRHQAGDPHSLSDNQVNAIQEDNRGVLWVGTNRGLNRFNRGEGDFVVYRHERDADAGLSNDVIYVLRADNRDGLWIGTEEGLNYFSLEKETFVSYRPERGNGYSLTDFLVRSLWLDRAGGLWVGTFSHGISKLDPWAAKFGLYFHNTDDPKSLGSNLVNGMAEDRSGHIWIGTADAGLDSFDPWTGHFQHYRHDPENPQSLGGPAAVVLLPEASGRLWVGTWGQGLDYLDPATGIFQHYRYDPADPHSLSQDMISALVADRAGNLWIGTWGGGLNYFDRAGGTFTRYQFDKNDPASLGDNRVSALYMDSKENLWVGVSGLGLEKFDPETGGFVHYRHDPYNPASIAPASVFIIMEDSRHALWLGTSTDLERFDPVQEAFTHYTMKDGFPSDYFYGILEDNQGRLWLSSNGGLSCFDPRTGEVDNYDVGDGLQGKGFRQLAFLKARNGELYFGGSQGFNRFHPERIQNNPYAPPIVLTDFKVFNQSVAVGSDSPLQERVTFASQIQLKYDQSVFSLDFASLDYTEPEKNLYAYRLEGVDKDWVYVDSQRRFATYTNLAPGTYTFYVKGSNSDGVWNGTGTSLQVVILPPWWMEWWFQGILLLGLVGVMGGGIHWHFYGMRKWRERVDQEIARRTADVRASEQNYRQILDSSMDGICRISPEGKILFSNQAYAEMFGYRSNEVIGCSFSKMLVDSAVQSGTESILTQVLSGKRVMGESWGRHQDGPTFPIQYNIIPVFEKGVVIGATGIIRDITVQRRAGKLLQESQERFAAVLNGIEVIIYVGDMQTHEILFANQHARQIFGDIEGKTCWQVLQQGKTGPCEFCTNSHLIDKAGRPTGIYTWDSRNARTGRWYHIQNEAIHWIDGRLARLEVATDITDLKLIEEQVVIQQRQLAALAERERIGRELHDDLGQVLGYIHLQAQTAQTLLTQEKYGPAKAALVQLVRVAREANTDIRHYILGMRRGADREAGSDGLIEDLQRYMRHLEETYAFQVRFSFPEERTELRLTSAVETQLLRIVQESLANARKHAGVKSAEVHLHWDRRTVQILIEDQGIGFILDQVESASHFGLEIMRERAVQIGGNLRVHSAPGRGTRIIVQAPRLLWGKDDMDDAGVRVLLADDHALFMEGLRTLLTLRGMQVVGLAFNGEEAVVQAQSLLPDLILMDINMPRCDGITATRRIKELFPEIRVVMLTVAADDETLFAALKAGASGYLLKGLDSDEFYRLLHELIRGEVPLAPGMAQRILQNFVKTESEAPVVSGVLPELTVQQNAVLELLAQGLTYKEIGQRLKLSERTVRYHLEQIVSRLQVANRRAAVDYYTRHKREGGDQ